MAPEILNKKPQTFSIDIWALGILLYEMFHKYAPFKGTTPFQIKKAIQKNKIEYKSPHMSAEARDLADWIL
jgi:serine/threonine protein kinase